VSPAFFVCLARALCFANRQLKENRLVHLTEPCVKETRESPPIGENTVFRAIVHEHWTPVYRFLYRLSGRVEEAE